MCPISDSTRSNSDSSSSGEVGDTPTPYQNIIELANTVPIIRIFKFYGLRLDEQNRKAICPFKSHKGGRENTPSFWYYPQTNSFRCYGCGVGHPHAHGCEFVAAIDGISRYNAAIKILESFASDVDEDNIINKYDFSERMEIMMDFSNTIREFRQNHSDEEAHKFIEYICSVYDRHNLKRELDNEALRRVVEQLKNKISSYSGDK